ncbi:hypothetical protein ACER0A_002525 [Haloimpatiens sp. FM7315]
MRQNKNMFLYIVDAIFLVTLAAFLVLFSFGKKLLVKPVSLVKSLINE